MLENTENTDIKIFFGPLVRNYFEVFLSDCVGMLNYDSYWTEFDKHDIPGPYLMDLISCDFLQKF